MTEGLQMLSADQSIIVTGGLGGIGFATAIMLLERGASVILADRVPATRPSRSISSAMAITRSACAAM